MAEAQVASGSAVAVGRARERGRLVRLWVALPVLAVLAVVLGLLVGHGDLGDVGLRDTLLRLRLWRVLTAFGAGASLAVAGVLVQGIFLNPLASPSVLGTTAGASFGGQAALIAGQWVLGATGVTWLLPEMLVPFGCVLGALASLLVLLAVTREQSSMLVVLLVGFLLSSLFLSMGSFLTSLAQESWELGRAVIAFTLGGVAGVGVKQAGLVAVVLVFGALAALSWASRIDVLLSGEEEAAALGVDVQQVRRWCIVWAAVLSAGAVAVGGNVAFVGLIVPHALRPFSG